MSSFAKRPVNLTLVGIAREPRAENSIRDGRTGRALAWAGRHDDLCHGAAGAPEIKGRLPQGPHVCLILAGRPAGSAWAGGGAAGVVGP